MMNRREKLKAELLSKAEAQIEALLDWHEGHQKPTFNQIEAEILRVRKKVGQGLTESLLKEEEANRAGPGPKCPSCGQEMRNKGQKPRQVKGKIGRVGYERGYYYCEACRAGFFPPR